MSVLSLCAPPPTCCGFTSPFLQSWPYLSSFPLTHHHHQGTPLHAMHKQCRVFGLLEVLGPKLKPPSNLMFWSGASTLPSGPAVTIVFPTTVFMVRSLAERDCVPIVEGNMVDTPRFVVVVVASGCLWMPPEKMMTAMNCVLVHFFVLSGGDGFHEYSTWVQYGNKCAHSAKLLSYTHPQPIYLFKHPKQCVRSEVPTGTLIQLLWQIPPSPQQSVLEQQRSLGSGDIQWNVLVELERCSEWFIPPPPSHILPAIPLPLTSQRIFKPPLGRPQAYSSQR